MIDWNSSGRLFHSLWPLKVNARWPAAVLQSGICRRSLFLVLQLCTSDLVLNFWQRYGGASPFKHLNIRPTFSGKESVTSSALLHQSGTTAMQNHSYKNAAVEKKNHLKFIFAGLVVPPFFVSMTTDLMLGRQFSLTLAGCLNNIEVVLLPNP